DFELFNCVKKDEYGYLMSFLMAEGYEIYVLEGVDIKSKDDLFSEIGMILPMPKDRTPARGSWDALADNLWEGFTDGTKKHCLVWKDASELMKSDMKSFLNIFDVFCSVFRSLYVEGINIIVIYVDSDNSFLSIFNRTNHSAFM
ncbi:MAG: barstar family protein, partial [Armatimonadetes bacterium]|nr:barstar family protein [Armatimonadota bacterium]